jgi:hypothetical protein
MTNAARKLGSRFSFNLLLYHGVSWEILLNGIVVLYVNVADGD